MKLLLCYSIPKHIQFITTEVFRMKERNNVDFKIKRVTARKCELKRRPHRQTADDTAEAPTTLSEDIMNQ